MNQRAIQLYQQAAAFAYQTAGADAGRGTIVESLTAGKFAELIVRECVEVALYGDEFDQARTNVKSLFGVEE